MFIPYEVDAPFDHQPVVNWLAIAGIVLVFAIQVVTSEKQSTAEKSKKVVKDQVEEVLKVPTEAEEAAAKKPEKKPVVTGPMARFALNGWGFGLLTYLWLQGGIIRFIGNLIFLWPFGNAVCGKLGNKLYPFVFLGFGLLAGVIHLLLGTGPAVGAGGVICGIVGIYVVLFPEDMMSCFVLLPRPMAVSVSGAWFVLLWFIFDLIAAGLGGSTTYYAHILCAMAGFGLAVLMLKKNWLVMEKDEKSLLQMLAKAREEVKEEIGEKKGAEAEIKDSQAVTKPPETAEKAKAEPNPISGDSHPLGKSASHFPAAGVSQPAQAAPAVQVASPQKTAAVAVKPDDGFIRFKCECGHRIKVHKKDAGKAGRCPKCSRWVEAPRQ
jgi:membrane associated rhomboid family serine protease